MRLFYKNVTVSEAIADLEAALENLEHAEDFHTEKQAEYNRKAEEYRSKALDESRNVERASRIRKRLSDLLA